MAATHVQKIVQASASNSAGGTTSGTEIDNTAGYGILLTARITNGGTGPAIGCDFVVYTGDASGKKREFSRQTAPVGNSAVQDFAVLIPKDAMYVNVDFTGNTGQAVTVECAGQQTTGI